MQDASEDSDSSRLENEVSLLEAMYPFEFSFNRKRREVTFKPSEGVKLCLRIPEGYPSCASPDIITASCSTDEIRNEIRRAIDDAPAGEESLDLLLTTFQDLVSAAKEEADHAFHGSAQSSISQLGAERSSTVIVWLHHLLSTTKRKAILAPPATSVSGISKPGYPGVLIFSGPSQYVNEHVRDLRGMNWQAFQVRVEEEGIWTFKHGSGIVEFESMAEIVSDIGDEKKEVFMEAMKMR